MQVFRHKSYQLLNGPHLLGLIFCVVGLASILSPLFVENEAFFGRTGYTGTAFLFIGMEVLTSYSGYSIDFLSKKFRRYQSLLGFKVGDWRALPEVAKIDLRTLSIEQTNTPNGISPTLAGTVQEHHILLLDPAGETILNLSYNRKKQAFQHAEILASRLKVELIARLQEES